MAEKKLRKNSTGAHVEIQRIFVLWSISKY